MPYTGQSKRKRESGSAIVEFSLLLLPLFAFLFILMDVGWIFFGWACIQEGARAGVRYAVTGSGMDEATLDAAIKLIVEEQSYGFAKDGNISIDYCPSLGYSSGAPPTCLDGQAGATEIGNVVKVTVQNVSMGSFGPIFRVWTPVNLSATAADVLQ